MHAMLYPSPPPLKKKKKNNQPNKQTKNNRKKTNTHWKPTSFSVFTVFLVL